MRAARLKAAPGDGYVRLTLAKGVQLILTVDEYVNALNRGKAEQRTKRRLAQQQQTQARREAKSLAWID